MKNILTIDNGNVIKTIEQKLKEIDYELHKHILNASYFGIPQARERVYFVALRKDMKATNKSALNCTKPKASNKKIFLENILEKEVDQNFIVTRNDIQITKDEENLEYKLKPIKIGILNKGGQGERIYSPKGHAITQSAYGGGVGAKTGLYKTEQGIRRLTINECKKVMGFPLKHKVSQGVQGYQQLGNAVVPQMIEYVFKNIEGVTI